MKKFFIVGSSYGESDECFTPEYRDYPERLSFSNYAHACVAAEKLERTRIIRNENGDAGEVRYESGLIYYVDVPDNWNGDDVASWLFEAMFESGYRLEPFNPYVQ